MRGCSPELDAHSPCFVTAADSFIPPCHEDILDLTSDTNINGDVFFVPFGRHISSGLTIAPSLVRFHDRCWLVTAFNPTFSTIALSQGAAMTCFADTEPLTLVALHMETRPLSSPYDDNSAVALTARTNDDLTDV